jgi:DNA primase
MDHANRLKLAHGIAQKLTDRYPAQLALVDIKSGMRESIDIVVLRHSRNTTISICPLSCRI